MNQTTGKKRVKIAAAAAVMSAAAIIIILVCVWNASSKNRTVEALNEGVAKSAESTSMSETTSSSSFSKQEDPKEKLRKELADAKAKLSAIKKEAEDIISDESVKATSSRLLLSFQEPSHTGRALLYYKLSFFNDMFWI